VEVIKRELSIEWLNYRGVLVAISLILTGLSVWLWVAKGDAKYGVDFRGGYEYIVRFSKPAPIEKVREVLTSEGIRDALVQNFEGGESEFSIRFHAEEGADAEASNKATKAVKTALGKISENSFELLKEDFVGPVIGEQIRRDGMKAFVIGLLGILIYVTIQFDLRYALGAVIALFHDAIVATGATIFMNIPFSAATLAAVLTIVGYSVNDTIIIYDRIRENVREATKSGGASKRGVAERLKGKSLSQIINFSINQTLARTVITSFTVMLVCLTLWLLGSGAVSELAFTLLVGVICGTYSTIFIASPVLLALDRGGNKSGGAK